MNKSMVTFEVQLSGQKPRLFRFTGPEVVIGFNPRCDLPLEPQSDSGAEVIVVIGDEFSLLRSQSPIGTFQLNDVACLGDSPIKPGDAITTAEYRITIRNLPVAAGAADAAGLEPPTVITGRVDRPAAPDLPAGSVLTAPEAKLPVLPSPDVVIKKDPPKRDGLSYLYLFFGPVKSYLEEDDVSEIMINGSSQIFIEQKGRVRAVPEKFVSEQALQAAVMNVARSVGRFFDHDNPRLDARLPDGSRVHAVIPPLSRAGTIVSIRKFRREKLTIEQLVEFGSLSHEGAELLNMIVKLGRNLIVSGATSSGKTSVLNVLSSLIPENERILVLEDASELQLQQNHKVCFETRKADEYGKGEVTIRDLLHSALRLRPDRIVVGEIRGGEALDLLQAMNTGHDGCMSTIHANSPRDSLLRMETCALLSGIELPLSALREQLASAIHIVIQTARLQDGTRKITAICEVLGLKDREYQLQDLYVFKIEGLSPGGNVLGRHVFTGCLPSFMTAARQHGLAVDDSMFAKV